MARFVFRLQSVLNIKLRLEEQQKLSFAAARRRLDDEELKLAGLMDRLSFYEDEGRHLRDSNLVLQDILDNEESIVRIKEYIVDQRQAVKRAEDALEEERLKLVEAIKERKMYEKLREKAFEEFMAEENHKEGVENDEHNSFVYSRRQLEATGADR
ncbi:MAG: flagellar export protein FliJ [Lachnospiraceae bacterium]|jgi:flagellar FliJ protein|nr:flagellar export protein FliJ [Lachnospiraceae bacterium]